MDKSNAILLNLIRLIRENNYKKLFIDLFAGAGGVSEGIQLSKGALVYYAINHDKNAIGSHKENHPYAFHADEDIKTFDLGNDIVVGTK